MRSDFAFTVKLSLREAGRLYAVPSELVSPSSQVVRTRFFFPVSCFRLIDPAHVFPDPVLEMNDIRWNETGLPASTNQAEGAI